MSPTLFVIGTPIGNLGDITLRAIETLGTVEVLYCEDSRVASHLINHLIERHLITNKPRYIPYNEFNESQIAQQVVADVAAGRQVGLISDAGMPTLSDPGYRAIRGCLDAGLKVEIIPGVSALTTAIAAAGVGGEQIYYLGFLPKKPGKRRELLETANLLITKTPSVRVVVFVSPHKIARELGEIKSVYGNAHAVLLRELTKKFEERVEGTIDELIALYTTRTPKGEMVLVISKPLMPEKSLD